MKKLSKDTFTKLTETFNLELTEPTQPEAAIFVETGLYGVYMTPEIVNNILEATDDEET